MGFPRKITELPLRTIIKNTDLIVSVDVDTDLTNKVTLESLATFIGGENQYVTGGTYNEITESINFVGNGGFPPFSVNVSGLTEDTYVTGATLNVAILEIGRNNGEPLISIDLSSLSGDTNTFVSGATLVGTTYSLEKNDGTTIPTDFEPIISGKVDTTLFNVYTANTQTEIDSKLNKSNFDTYSANTETEIDSKISNGINNGGGNEIFSGKSGNDLYFKTLSGGSNTTLTNVGDVVKINVTIPADTNTFITGTSLNNTTYTINQNDGSTFPTDFEPLISGFTTGSTLQQVIENGSVYSGGEIIVMNTAETIILSSNVMNTLVAFGLNNSGTTIMYEDNLNNEKRELSITNNGLLITDEIDLKGVEYASDYSTNFTNESLITKRYVDGVVSGKVDTTLFNTYTANTETEINSKLDITTFDTYTANTVDNNIFVVSGEANAATQQLTFTNTSGGTFNVVNAAALFSDNDINVTGGTYDNNTGCVTFTTNSGTTFPICGFITGLTDTYTTSGVYDNNTGEITFTRTDSSTYNVDLSTLDLNDKFVSGGTYNSGTTTFDFVGNNGFPPFSVGVQPLLSPFEFGTGVDAVQPRDSSYNNSTQNTVWLGGTVNKIMGDYNFIGNGLNHSIEASADYSFIGNGNNNQLGDGVNFLSYSAILAGKDNTIEGTVSNSAIIAGENNTITHSNTFILGSNISSTQTGTTYVENLNIGSLGSGISVNNLGIDANGNVVVGSSGTSSTDTFVTGSTFNGDSLTIRRNDGVDIVVTGFTSPLWLSNVNGIHYNSGNVGIGMSASSVNTKLEINYSGTSERALRIKNVDNNSQYNFGTELRDGEHLLRFDSDNSGITPLVLSSVNKVGVGIPNTIAPEATLHIYSTSDSQPIVLVEDETNPDTTPFIIDIDGNVGIGTGTPTEKLDVSGNTKISGTLNIGTVGSTTSVNNLGVDTNGNVVVGSSGTSSTDTYVTGATLNGNTLELERNNSLTAVTVDLSSLSATTPTIDEVISEGNQLSNTNSSLQLPQSGSIDWSVSSGNQNFIVETGGSNGYIRIVNEDGELEFGDSNRVSLASFSGSDLELKTGGNTDDFRIYLGTNGPSVGDVLEVKSLDGNTGLMGWATPNDVFVSSGEADAATQQLTFTNTSGGTFNVTNAAALFSDNDINVTGGTYNPNNGCVTFTTNSGSSFNVCGFLTGLTDTFISGSTLVGTEYTLERTDGVNITTDFSSIVSGKVDISLFNSYSADTQTKINDKLNTSTFNTYTANTTDNVVTGATLVGTTLSLERNNGLLDVSVDLGSLTGGTSGSNPYTIKSGGDIIDWDYSTDGPNIKVTLSGGATNIITVDSVSEFPNGTSGFIIIDPSSSTDYKLPSDDYGSDTGIKSYLSAADATLGGSNPVRFHYTYDGTTFWFDKFTNMIEPIYPPSVNFDTSNLIAYYHPESFNQSVSGGVTGGVAVPNISSSILIGDLAIGADTTNFDYTVRDDSISQPAFWTMGDDENEIITPSTLGATINTNNTVSFYLKGPFQTGYLGLIDFYDGSGIFEETLYLYSTVGNGPNFRSYDPSHTFSFPQLEDYSGDGGADLTSQWLFVSYSIDETSNEITLYVGCQSSLDAARSASGATNWDYSGLGDTVSIDANGLYSETASVTIDETTFDRFYYGNSAGGGEGALCSLGMLGIYSSVISDSQILTNWESSRSTYYIT